MKTFTIHNDDCLTGMAALAENSIDAIVTDPPYGLSFMGKMWDHGVPGAAFWQEALRVAKPGAHLLAFGGTRTYHRLTCAIEDAGWEIRDCLMWVYGSGFPKSHNGHWGGTALKPAFEPIILARKPLTGTVAANVQEWGTGGLNIDGCRVVAVTEDDYGRSAANADGVRVKGAVNAYGEFCDTVAEYASPLGRWPANLIHDGSPEVVGLFPVTDGVVGAKRVGGDKSIFSGGGHQQTAKQKITGGTKDTGSAARFFYCAKASKSDRGDGNTHPTVKPNALMRYLCRLITPPNGLILDMFTGSGSTGKAAMLEGFRFIGFEKEAEYAEIARARCAAVLSGQPLLQEAV